MPVFASELGIRVQGDEQESPLLDSPNDTAPSRPGRMSGSGLNTEQKELASIQIFKG